MIDYFFSLPVTTYIPTTFLSICIYIIIYFRPLLPLYVGPVPIPVFCPGQAARADYFTDLYSREWSKAHRIFHERF